MIVNVISVIKHMNKLMLIFVITLGLCSCEREASWIRNWQVPVDLNDPGGPAGGGSITYQGDVPDSVLIQRIIEGQNLTANEIKYLSLSPGAYNSREDHLNIENPDPRYMRFPHSIASTSDNWGWDHLYELCQIGEEEFCNKYFNGERTLGMTFGPWNCDYVESWY